MELSEGRIAAAPEGDDQVMVTLDDFDGGQELGPCAYMPRGDVEPAAGDRCLVAHGELDGHDAWWVIAFHG